MEILIKHFPKLRMKQIKKFDKMKKIYSYWNNKTNLISRKTFNNFYVNHVLHSLSIAKIISFSKKSKITDIGTGGGFPGIPMSIFFDKCSFLLVDLIYKKIKILKKIKKELKLNNVKLSCKDIKNTKEKFDFIISRGLCHPKNIFNKYKKIIKNKSKNKIPNGLLYLGYLKNKHIKDDNIRIYNIYNYINNIKNIKKKI